jgi:hypothetical protein
MGPRDITPPGKASLLTQAWTALLLARRIDDERAARSLWKWTGAGAGAVPNQMNDLKWLQPLNCRKLRQTRGCSMPTDHRS